MTALHWIVLFVALQRLAELIVARRNTKQLLSEGGVEYGAAHYPLFVVLHGAWLASLLLFIPAETAPSLWLIGVFVLLQAARVWVMATLGRFWTTRVISLPGVPLIRSGPYRFVRHPNYWIVAFEIAVLPAAFGAYEITFIFSVANALLLRRRLQIEESALSGRHNI